jgi:nitronate monooxygenase
VQGVEQARAALGEGADVLVAQGTEAGGHAGARATLPLVPAVVDLAGAVPVLAAGGIADGRGLAAALMLGAAGVLCGTAFFASEEALSHPNAKRAAVQATGDDTERGSVFDLVRGLDWPRGWTIRGLRNRFSEQWGADLPGLLRNLEREQARYTRASEQGDTSVAAVVVGEATGLVRATEPAAAIVQRIVADAERLLREAPGRFVT